MAGDPSKQPYLPPAVRKIKIVQGEMAVTGCKTRLSTTGPTIGCFRSNCRATGS